MFIAQWYKMIKKALKYKKKLPPKKVAKSVKTDTPVKIVPACKTNNPISKNPIRVEVGYKFGDINGKIFEQYMLDHTFAKDMYYDDCKKELEKILNEFLKETCESLKFFFEKKE